MSKVLYLNGSKFRFKVDTIWIDWIKTNNLELKSNEKKQMAIICIKDLSRDIDIVHPLTDFLYHYWRYKSYNTQRKHALNVVSFLNFILENRMENRISSLTDLKLDHAENFLNYKTIIGMKRESIKGIENTLSLFYRYLSKHECLPNVPSTSFDSYINTDGKEVPISPFNNVILPSKETTSIEHTFPIEYIPVLFELASIIAKPITLGLYLQIFGGLRIGEVANIKRSSIKHQVNAEVIVINLVERNLRTDIKDASGSNYVKKPRKQQIFILRDWFDSLYKDHLELYKSTDGSGALFVNRDGKAMSAKSYRQYFDKVKKEFIKILKNSSKIDDKLLAHHLKVTKWSTQIGRGIFSNLLAEYAENPYDIAVPRGDDSLLSSLTYLKGTVRYRDKLLERLNNMHTNYIPSLLDESTR